MLLVVIMVSRYTFIQLMFVCYEDAVDDHNGDDCRNLHSCILYDRDVRGLVAKALDLQLAGCEFNSRPRRCRVTTLGKLFTPTWLSRLQSFSSGMIDCGVRGRSQLCLSRQPLRCAALARAAHPSCNA